MSAETNKTIDACRRTFGTAFTPTGVSRAAANVAAVNAETYHDTANGTHPELDGRSVDDFVRSWRTAPDKYDGQASKARIQLETILLARKGWRETTVDDHFAMRSPSGEFIVRYVPVGKTQVRTYFERVIQ